MPVLGPVDHSSSNDNHLFLSAASLMDQSLLEPDSYRWSSATGQYHTVHAYSLKANNTLSKLCPYPVPPLYRLGMHVYRVKLIIFMNRFILLNKILSHKQQ